MTAELPNRYDQSSSTISATQADIDMDGLSYSEYFYKVEEMTEHLRCHWKQEQRVKALKIAIQLSKLLADTSQLDLYTKKYKLITTTLDEFGQLIYSRLQSMLCEESNSHQVSISTSVLHIDPREKTGELCKNWFSKVASIRELAPRFYTELCILRIFEIILKPSPPRVGLTQEQYYSQSIKRLTKAAWGFGNPIVTLHARNYLCKVAKRLIKWSDSESSDALLFELILENIKASSTVISNLNVASVMQTVHTQNVELAVFFDLVSGPLQSIINLIALREDVYTNDDEISDNVGQKLEVMIDSLMLSVKKNECSVFGAIIITNSTFRAFPSDIVAKHFTELLKIILNIYQRWKDFRSDDMYLQMIVSTLYLMLESYGLALDRSDIFERNTDDAMRKSILESIETIQQELLEYESKKGEPISTFYLRCFSAWVSYANHYIGHSKLSSMLQPFIIKIKKNRQHTNESSSLLELIKILISNKKMIEEFRDIFKLKCFKQLLELICKDDQKLYISELILETIRANLKLNCQRETIHSSDKVMVNFLLDLFATINDSLGLLSAQDDINHLSQLVIYFLEEISIEDYKEHLEFFSRCRGLLGNLNLALEYLARRVLNLANDHISYEHKRSLRQNYLNGCLAYTFITIPAISCHFTRLDLSLEGSRIALGQMSLSLADYYLKQTLNILTDLLRPYKKEYAEESIAEDASTNTLQFNTNKQILDRVKNLINVVTEFEDHVDLKHKLELTEIIKDFFYDNSSLIMSMKRLNLIDDYSE